MTLSRTMYAEIQETESWKAAHESLLKKREKVIEQLGEKWILHPVHFIKKKEDK